jgi:hypothetical protein
MFNRFKHTDFKTDLITDQGYSLDGNQVCFIQQCLNIKQRGAVKVQLEI